MPAGYQTDQIWQVRGTGMLAELALPVVGKHLPGLIRFYLRAENVDMEKARVLVRTVEDPVPAVNQQIARWLQQRDLIIDGVNVTEELGRFEGPFIGAIIVTIFPEVFRVAERLYFFIFALSAILILIFMPKGAVTLWDWLFKRLSGKEAPRLTK